MPPWARRGWQVNVNARTKADQAVALPPREAVARFDVTQDATGKETGALHQGHDLTVRIDDDSIALVVTRGNVEIGADEVTGKILNLLDDAIDTGSVALGIEEVHEHTDAQGVTVGVGVAGFFNLDNAAVGRREDRSRLRRHLTR